MENKMLEYTVRDAESGETDVFRAESIKKAKEHAREHLATLAGEK